MTDQLKDVTLAVIDRLKARGVEATLEYPGFIAVPTADGRVWNIGTANGSWGADLTSADGGDVYKAVVLCDSSDVDVITERILTACAR